MSNIYRRLHSKTFRKQSTTHRNLTNENKKQSQQQQQRLQ